MTGYRKFFGMPKRRSVGAFCALLISATVWLWCHHSSTPEGTYHDEFIGSEGPSYWVFKDGKVKLKAPGTDKDIEGYREEDMGTYSKLGTEWVMRGGPKDPEVILKPNLFGMRTVCNSESYSYMNRFLPRRGFLWIKAVKSFHQVSEAE